MIFKAILDFFSFSTPQDDYIPPCELSEHHPAPHTPWSEWNHISGPSYIIIDDDDDQELPHTMCKRPAMKESSLAKMLRLAGKKRPCEGGTIHLLSVSQASEYANVSRQTLYTWLWLGKLHGYFGSFKWDNEKAMQKVAWISPVELDELLWRKQSPKYHRG